MDIHKEFPKTVSRDDFWSQIKRTVNGQPVSEENINRIVFAIRNALLRAHGERKLLDLGCGNAALASRLFDDVDEYTGVDFSEYLIGVAREFFMHNKVKAYVEGDILDFLKSCSDCKDYTHVLCYGVFSYLPKIRAQEFFKVMVKNFPNVKSVFVGNLPDADKADSFFAKRSITDFELDNEQSPIGVWWRPSEISKIATDCGWNCYIERMPPDFYASEYRFDLVLSRG
jgi:SAM-dependent methyltransferase